MTVTLSEFRRQIRGPQTAQQKIRNSWGVYDYYKYYRKNKPEGHEFVLTESQYFAIIRKINQKICDGLLKYDSITFPYHMGSIEIMRKPINDRIVDGKLKTYRKIDWGKTLELWYSEPQAYKKKTLVYFETTDKYLLFYRTGKATYNNKGFYEFKPNKTLMQRLAEQIKDGNIYAPYFLDMGDNNNIKGLYDG